MVYTALRTERYVATGGSSLELYNSGACRACLPQCITPRQVRRFIYQLRPEHLHDIETLADEANQPLEEVKMLYAEILAGLGMDARIQDYLLVLTSKKVRNVLRRTRVSASAGVLLRLIDVEKSSRRSTGVRRRARTWVSY